jgi:site-specific DNA recombinase
MSNTIPSQKIVRCAIYTRKSVTEGLEQEFNTLDAQREAAEAFIASQRHEGWVALPEHYDDGGFTGGNTERPALKALMADVEAGQVDCIVVYKVDRLSRSLLDFAMIMGALDKHNCAFVSVTQQFNTSHSMGRLTLNILLSFAQFEREIIAERTRDKIHSARRKGKWTGGPPILGYDVAPNGGRLLVNPEEAVQVRAIFEHYVESESLTATLRWANAEGFCTKSYTTRKGIRKTGRPFSKSSLHALLTNVQYIGKMTLKTEVFDGEHEAIISPGLWKQAQARMEGRSVLERRPERNKTHALLRGLLYAEPDGVPMYHSFTTKQNRHYRYYVHRDLIKRADVSDSATRSVPAGDIEAFVLEKIKVIGQSEQLAAETIRQARLRRADQLNEWEADARELRRAAARTGQDIHRLAGATGEEAVAKLATLHDRLGREQGQLAEINAQIAEASAEALDERALVRALSDFDGIWDALRGEERVKLIHLLIQRVGYNAQSGEVRIDFHPSGLNDFILRQAS